MKKGERREIFVLLIYEKIFKIFINENNDELGIDNHLKKFCYRKKDLNNELKNFQKINFSLIWQREWDELLDDESYEKLSTKAIVYKKEINFILFINSFLIISWFYNKKNS